MDIPVEISQLYLKRNSHKELKIKILGRDFEPGENAVMKNVLMLLEK